MTASRRFSQVGSGVVSDATCVYRPKTDISCEIASEKAAIQMFLEKGKSHGIDIVMRCRQLSRYQYACPIAGVLTRDACGMVYFVLMHTYALELIANVSRSSSCIRRRHGMVYM